MSSLSIERVSVTYRYHHENTNDLQLYGGLGVESQMLDDLVSGNAAR